MNRSRILLVSDVREWAFDINAHDMAACLADEFDFDFGYVIDGGGPIGEAAARADAVFWFHFSWDTSAAPNRSLSGLRTSWFDHLLGNRIGDDVARWVRWIEDRYCAFQVVTQPSYEALAPHCARVVYLTNPVEVSRFAATEPRSEVIAAWNGNAAHAGPDHKGFHTIIQPVCEQLGVPLCVAEYNTSRLRPAEMPAFYARATVSLCASISEGASNSVMEAMAAGHALVATPVGNIPELHASQLAAFGESGILLVERTPAAFTQALAALRADPRRVAQMGALNRREIAERWSWSAWRTRYAEFLRRAVHART